ncbi:MAG: hypothetical protein H6559_33090 [Lewinellaceae bacterium]|nr:hypothetical protein [Lewinellaceae bacterium]
MEQAFGIVQLLDEPEDWKDIPEYNHGKEEEYLDFDMEGGSRDVGRQSRSGEKRSCRAASALSAV